jgi:hypothetical protein
LRSAGNIFNGTVALKIREVVQIIILLQKAVLRIVFNNDVFVNNVSTATLGITVSIYAGRPYLKEILS